MEQSPPVWDSTQAGETCRMEADCLEWFFYDSLETMVARYPSGVLQPTVENSVAKVLLWHVLEGFSALCRRPK